MNATKTYGRAAFPLALSAIALAGCAAPTRLDAQETASAAAQTAKITPDQWFKKQPKPVFKPGHTMPRLTRYGWDLSFETNEQIAENWNYAQQFNYTTQATVDRALNDPKSKEARMVALTLTDPKRYPLAVTLSRDEPANPALETFLRDADGKLVQGNTYSLLNPQSVLDQMAELRAAPLRNLRARVPIAIILNGGEYGLGVLGFIKPHAIKDPKVMVAKGDQDWFEFLSRAKARERNTIAEAVRKAVPDRSLYIYYSSGNVERNRFGGWKEWSYDDTYTIGKNSDLPSNEYYYKHFNSGYLPDAGGNDILTRALNAVGFQLTYDQKNSYDWLSSGWVYEADARGNPLPPKTPKPTDGDAATPQLQEGNAAALVDPNAGVLSSMELYTGFLKCLFTTGTLGGNAGYYAFPIGGFTGSFEENKPAQWAQQMARLAHVQALFSHLEGDLRNGDLLPGPKVHRWSKAQPAYEFPTGSGGVRVVGRKHSKQKRWLFTAWAADGVARMVKVPVPELGEVELLARPVGSTFVILLRDGRPELWWTDENGMMPTFGGFKPRLVTAAQLRLTLPVISGPPMQNLYQRFVASSGVVTEGENRVTNWIASGVPDVKVVLALTASGTHRPVLVTDAAALEGITALRFNGVDQRLTSEGLAAEVAELLVGTLTAVVVYASDVPQAFTAQNGGNNQLLSIAAAQGAPYLTGLAAGNGDPPVAGRKTWQVRQFVRDIKTTPRFMNIGAPATSDGATHNAFIFKGDIAEILIYRGQKNPTQAAELGRYLQSRYGL